MTIQEAYTFKRDLTEDMQNKIGDFERKTGMRVESVDLQRRAGLDAYSKEVSTFLDVDLTIRMRRL
jgi:hypothetical protein